MRHSATKALLERTRHASSSRAYPASTASARRRSTSTTCSSSSSAASSVDRDQILRKLVDIQYERNDVDFHRGTFRVRGDVVEIFPAYEEARAPRRVLRRHHRGDHRDRLRCAARRCAGSQRVAVYPASHYVTERAAPEASRSTAIRDELQRAPQRAARPRTSCSRAQRLEQRTTVRPRDARARWASVTASRTTRATSTAAQPGEPPSTLDQLLPRRLPADHRREPRHRTADRRHVPRRPRRARRRSSSSASGCRRRSTTARSTSREFEGCVGQTRLRVGDAGPTTSSSRAAGVVVEQIIRPTGLIDPGGRASGRRATRSTTCSRRSARRVEVDERRAGDDAHQEDGRGPDRLLPGRRRQGALHPLRRRDDRARRDHPRPPRAASSTCWSGSTSCARGSTSRRSRWSRSSTPTRKAILRSSRSLDPDHRPRRPQRQRHRHHVRRHRDRSRCSTRSTRPRAGAPSRRQYNEEHGIVPQTIRKAISWPAASRSPTPTTSEAPSRCRSADEDWPEPRRDPGDARPPPEGDARRAATALEFERAAELRDRVARARAPSAGRSPEAAAVR